MARFQLFLVLFSLHSLLHLPSLTATGAHPAYDDQPSCFAAASSSDPLPPPLRREEFDEGSIIDITHFYRHDMPSWESTEGLGQFLRLADSTANGSQANGSELKLGAHSRTHVDPPGHVFQHYFEASFDVDTLELELDSKIYEINWGGCLLAGTRY